MHSAYVLDDSSDRGHLLSFTGSDDARDLFSLVAMAIFLNALDERTYRLSSETYQEDPTILQQCHDVFDLNAIPVIERHHLCYVRGLSIDLLNWFFEHYAISSIDLEEEDVDAFSTIFIPFIVHIGRQIIKYKRLAEERGKSTSPSSKEVRQQIQLAMFGFDFARDVWLEEKAMEEEEDYFQDADEIESFDFGACDLNYDLSAYFISPRMIPAARESCENYLEGGKTNADKRFFRGLIAEFNVENIGKYFVLYNFSVTRQSDIIFMYATEYSEDEDSEYL
jgi:hypothetical protein